MYFLNSSSKHFTPTVLCKASVELFKEDNAILFIEHVFVFSRFAKFGPCKLCSFRNINSRTGLRKVASQLVLKSIRSHFGPLVFIDLVNACSFDQFVLTVWSIRTHFGQLLLILVNSYSRLW